MTDTESRIRAAAFLELGRILSAETIEFSLAERRGVRRAERLDYRGTLSDGISFEVSCERGDGPRAWFRLDSQAGETLAAFRVNSDGSVSGNPAGPGYPDTALVGPAFAGIALDLAGRAKEASGDDFTFTANAPAAGFWIAEFESRNTNCRAFGATPEEAVATLDALWRDRYADASGADPEYLADNRDSVSVHPADVGRAYILAGGDWLWHKGEINGGDERFDATFRAAAPALGR